MLSWLKESQSSLPTHRRRVRLAVEPLEPRDYLSAAMIMSFQVTQGSGTQVTLSGFIMDESPATARVNFTGVVAGSATPNMMGYFQYTGQASGLGTVTAVAVDNEHLSSNPAQAQVISSAPSISNFLVTETTNGKMVTVNGTVMDESPSGRTVTFSGALTGSLTTGANGIFSGTLEATSLGTVLATTTDMWGLSSSPVQAQVMSAAPVVSNLAVSETGVDRMVTVTGTVLDMSPGGRTVTLGGVVSGTVITAANGTFSATLQASALGTVTAVATDIWGQQSAMAQAPLTSAAPLITSFTAVSVDENWWELSGTVTDEKYYGLSVVFGGLLSGYSCTVDAYGTFSFLYEFAEGVSGIVSAQTTDWWGLASNIRETFVDNRV